MDYNFLNFSLLFYHHSTYYMMNLTSNENEIYGQVKWTYTEGNYTSIHPTPETYHFYNQNKFLTARY